ncbi:hypothetical protein B2I21_09915 [Chryseobacterium mucoviscidosis]|nr:hypothetical protein B2I21_09915 [Chryseobacterium mucoviscidosis]
MTQIKTKRWSMREGCSVHVQEIPEYRKITASRERSHPFKHFYNSYAVIISKFKKKDKPAYSGGLA